MFCLYLQDLDTGFNIIYIYKSISDSLLIIDTAFIQIRNIYKYKLKVLYFNSERTLGNEYKALIIKLGIRKKRLVPKTHKQPKSERAGRLLTIKTKSMIIKTNMPNSMQNKVYKITGYIANKTPTKRLKQRTPFKIFIKSMPTIAYIYLFNYKAFSLIYKIFKLAKISPRAQIGYLYNYNSTNIFRI